MTCPNAFGPKTLSRWAIVLIKSLFIFYVGHRGLLEKLLRQLLRQKPLKIRSRANSIISEVGDLLPTKSSAKPSQLSWSQSYVSVLEGDTSSKSYSSSKLLRQKSINSSLASKAYRSTWKQQALILLRSRAALCRSNFDLQTSGGCHEAIYPFPEQKLWRHVAIVFRSCTEQAGGVSFGSFPHYLQAMLSLESDLEGFLLKPNSRKQSSSKLMRQCRNSFHAYGNGHR